MARSLQTRLTLVLAGLVALPWLGHLLLPLFSAELKGLFIAVVLMVVVWSTHSFVNDLTKLTEQNRESLFANPMVQTLGSEVIRLASNHLRPRSPVRAPPRYGE